MKSTLKSIKKIPKSECLVLIHSTTNKTKSALPKLIPSATQTVLLNFMKKQHPNPKENKLYIFSNMSTLTTDWISIIQINDKNTDLKELRNLAADTIRKCKENSIKTINWLIDDFLEESHLKIDKENVYQVITEGAIIGNYSFDTFKNKKHTKKITQSIFLNTIQKNKLLIKESIQKGTIIGDSSNLAKDLANTPANYLQPKDFVKLAKELKKNHSKIKLTIIDQEKAKKLKMGAFLSVGQGSDSKSYIIILEHLPHPKTDKIALVGKGVTFDSGGVSLKPGRGMSNMKADMSGAAAVFASFSAITKLNVNKNVMAVIPVTENMCSSKAQRPGDIVTAMNKKTIEIINTDAEGRLILADSLCYVSKDKKVTEVIDIATLTGACSTALGNAAAGIMGKNQGIIDQFTSQSHQTNEKFWQLPLYDEYYKYLESDTADLKNCSENRLAGTSTAAKFLEQFVTVKNWTHLDIASVMKSTTSKGSTSKGMTGFGTLSLIYYIINK